MPADRPASHLDLDRVTATFDERGMYDAVVDAGYMRHGELAAALAAWARTQNQPLTVVDLGCGDAWLAANAFGAAHSAGSNQGVEHYLGVDASEPSIQRARRRLGPWGDRAKLIVSNLAEAVKTLPDDFASVVLASYSIHHFASDGKQAVLADCARVLHTGGTLFWIDVVRRDDETRDAMINRLTATIAADWTALTPDGREKACTHIRESDFPETAAWMRNRAAEAGLACVETIFHDEFFIAMRFVKHSA